MASEMTVGTWIAEATARLERAGVDSPRLEAQLLAADALGVDRTWVLVHPEASFESDSAETKLARREAREPLAYLLGWREFYGRRFFVAPGVLIPRQETECLIEAVLDLLGTETSLDFVLDVGCGSGCIAITLALETDLHVTALDVSPIACEVTRRNAHELGATLRVVQSDRLAEMRPQSIHLLVSNPPYIEAGVELMPEVGRFEPPEALFAGSDGLDAYRWLAEEGAQAVVPGGWAVLEIGMGQGNAVREVFAAQGWTFMRSVSDLSRIERVLLFRR